MLATSLRYVSDGAAFFRNRHPSNPVWAARNPVVREEHLIRARYLECVRTQPSVQTPRSRSTDCARAEVLATFPWLGGAGGGPPFRPRPAVARGCGPIKAAHLTRVKRHPRASPQPPHTATNTPRL